MKGKMKRASILFAALAAVPASAQVPVQVAVPAGAQQNPTGFITISPTTADFWMGDRNLGFVHYIQNPNVPGEWMIDPAPQFSIGGPAPNNLPFSYVGQLVQVSDTLGFIVSPDPQKPQQGFIRGAGIYLQQFVPQFQPPVSTLGNTIPLTIAKGIAGDVPTAGAFGPDGKFYYGGLKGPNLRRVTNPTGDASTQQVETFGTALNNMHVLSLSFSGSDLYVATGDGFYVVSNAASCNGNQNNCGQPVLVASGAAVATAVDQFGHVYFATALGAVRRFTPVTQSMSLVASGLSFGPGVTGGLGIDKLGNLWIGQSSEIDYVLASDLAMLP